MSIKSEILAFLQTSAIEALDKEMVKRSQDDEEIDQLLRIKYTCRVGWVLASNLANHFDRSEATIRKYLNQLIKEGLVCKSRRSYKHNKFSYHVINFTKDQYTEHNSNPRYETSLGDYY